MTTWRRATPVSRHSSALGNHFLEDNFYLQRGHTLNSRCMPRGIYHYSGKQSPPHRQKIGSIGFVALPRRFYYTDLRHSTR